MITGLVRVTGFTLGLYVLQPQCGIVGMVVGLAIITIVGTARIQKNGRTV